MPLEVLDTLDTDIPHEEWPTFSLDVYSRYSFFVTHSKGVYFFSLETWLHNLEAELQNNSGAGATFRINVFRNGPGTLRERVLQFDKDNRHSWASDPTACLVFQDSDLGYFLLTSAGGQPHAITFDKPNLGFSEPFPAKEDDIHPDPSLLDFDPPREAYQPPASLWAQPSLSTFFTKNISNRYKKTMKDEIRLSPATMDLMTEAHRVLSQETKQLGAAAADLFRRCDRLQDELRDQIKRANEAANKIEDIIGHDGDDYGVTSLPSQRSADLEKRIQAAIGRQEKLLDRQENLRMKVSQLGGNKLSKNEELWASEIEKINDSLMGSEEKDDENIGKEPLKPWRRFNEVCLT